MSQMVHIQVGQCGNRIGTRFWQSVCAEHNLNDCGYSVSDDPERAYGRQVLFDETKRGRFSPRTVLVDMEPSALDSIRAGPCGRLFTPDQYVFDTCGTGNLFVRGYYAAEFSEVVLDGIRRIAESTDCLLGFQLSHSVSRGTGSGLGTLLISKLRDEYPDRLSCTDTLFPSATVSDSVIEMYNAVLSVDRLVENADLVAMFDNESLFALAHRGQSIESPTYADLNHLVSDSMVHMTCPMRFHGSLNSNLRKMAVNLVPIPRLHFVNVVEAPLSTREGKSECLSVPAMIESLFDFRNCMGCAKSRSHSVPHGLTASAVFRGDISPYEVEHGLATASIHSHDFFREWFAGSLSSSICSTPATDRPASALLLANCNLFAGAVAPMCEKFTAMYRRKAFLHWYTAEGMDDMEITEALCNVNDLVSDYAFIGGCRDCGIEEDLEEGGEQAS